MPRVKRHVSKKTTAFVLNKKADRKAATTASRLLEQYASEYRAAFFFSFEKEPRKRMWITDRHMEHYRKIKDAALDLRVSLGPDCD